MRKSCPHLCEIRVVLRIAALSVSSMYFVTFMCMSTDIQHTCSLVFQLRIRPFLHTGQKEYESHTHTHTHTDKALSAAVHRETQAKRSRPRARASARNRLYSMWRKHIDTRIHHVRRCSEHASFYQHTNTHTHTHTHIRTRRYHIIDVSFSLSCAAKLSITHLPFPQ